MSESFDFGDWIITVKAGKTSPNDDITMIENKSTGVRLRFTRHSSGNKFNMCLHGLSSDIDFEKQVDLVTHSPSLRRQLLRIVTR